MIMAFTLKKKTLLLHEENKNWWFVYEELKVIILYCKVSKFTRNVQKNIEKKNSIRKPK